MTYEISKCGICLHETPQHQSFPPPLSHKNPRILVFFFLPVQPCLSSISALLKRQNNLMIQDSRWRDCCQQHGEKKKTFWVMIDIPASFYYSCDVCPDTLMPEIVASYFGWCSNLVICVSLPANHLAVCPTFDTSHLALKHPDESAPGIPATHSCALCRRNECAVSGRNMTDGSQAFYRLRF